MLNDLSNVVQLVNDGIRIWIQVSDSEPLPKTGKRGVRMARKAEMADQVKKQNHRRNTRQDIDRLIKMGTCWWSGMAVRAGTDLQAEGSHFLSRWNFIASGGVLATWWSHLTASAASLCSTDSDRATSHTFPVSGQNLSSHLSRSLISLSLGQNCIPGTHLICTFLL